MFGISFLTKENITLFGVALLFIWRIIDIVLKSKNKRQYEIEKMAFEMAKYRLDDPDVPLLDKPILSSYTFYLDALKKGIRNPNQLMNHLVQKEKELDSKIEEFEDKSNKYQEALSKLEEKSEISLDDIYVRDLNLSSYIKRKFFKIK